MRFASSGNSDRESPRHVPEDEPGGHRDADGGCRRQALGEPVKRRLAERAREPDAAVGTGRHRRERPPGRTRRALQHDRTGRGGSAEDDPLTTQPGRASVSATVPPGVVVTAVPVVNHVERRPSAVRAVPAGTLFGPALPSITSERTRPEG